MKRDIRRCEKCKHYKAYKTKSGVWAKACESWECVPEIKKKADKETETWNGIHTQATAPKGTFERIFNEADDNDI